MQGLAAREAAVLAEVDRLSREERVVDWVSGACLLVRRAAAECACDRALVSALKDFKKNKQQHKN